MSGKFLTYRDKDFRLGSELFCIGLGAAATPAALFLCVEGKLSWQAVTWVLEFSEATSYSRLVLLSIASHANREGKNAFPSLDTIARESLISRREVIYCVQELEEKGELSVIRGIGRGNPNHYELRHVGTWLEKVHNMHQLKGARSELKGANRRTKGANTTQKQVSNLLESSKSKTERLEPSKALTVKQVAKNISIPEPSKSKPELLAERDRQIAVMREKGYLQ